MSTTLQSRPQTQTDAMAELLGLVTDAADSARSLLLKRGKRHPGPDYVVAICPECGSDMFFESVKCGGVYKAQHVCVDWEACGHRHDAPTTAD